MRSTSIIGLAIAGLLAAGSVAPALAQSAQSAYSAALARERAVRVPNSSLEKMRSVIATYENIPRRYPQSGYSDNALWQAAGLAFDAFFKFGQERDRKTGLRLLEMLLRSYPTSSLRHDATTLLARFEIPPPLPPPLPPPTKPAVTANRQPAAPSRTAAASADQPTPDAEITSSAPEATTGAIEPPPPATIRSITRKSLPEGVRITMEFDGEVPYHAEELANPTRLFFDFKNAQAARELRDATLTYSEDVVSVIRLGRRPNNTTRVVLDMANVTRHSVFVTYNPYRIVIDCERGPSLSRGVSTLPGLSAAPAVVEGTEPPRAPLASAGIAPSSEMRSSGRAEREEEDARPNVAAAAPTVPAKAADLPVPKPPSANGSGGFSLARQLGLGVARIVIDPGHGGHDPGADSGRDTEAELVLDIALRLEQLLLKQPGVEVVMTRRTDAYVPLDERTAIANREHADLFLSIHANASENSRLGGVETYFLDFASSPDAEETAARENSASGRQMHTLPDIVRAIALNTKLDESRDLAKIVQDSMVKRLRLQHKTLRSLGVKRAPFVVLIGAAMPSVLTEISFLTNKEEAQLLATTRYRDRIAEALAEAVLKYRRSLKNQSTAVLQ